MRRTIGILLALTACAGPETSSDEAATSATIVEPLAAEGPSAEELEQERIAREYPMEATVRLFQAAVKARPSRDAETIGFIRRGVTVRARSTDAGEGCKEGWLELHPEGFFCRGFDVIVGEELPEDQRDLTPPRRHDDLPYDYYFVTLEDAPVMRRKPNPKEREAVVHWLSRLRHHRRLGDEKKLERFLADALPDEPSKPRFVDRLLARGYYVSSPKGLPPEGRLIRNAQGEYLLADTLKKVDASELRGVELGGEIQLPFGFVTRPVRPLRVIRDEGGVRFEEDPDEEPLPRYAHLPGAKPTVLVGDFLVHELADGRVLKDWFAGVAEKIDPPFKVKDDEVWIHVDIGEQTLVLYRGKTPFFATLVSTGVDGHDTPQGLFRVEKKFVGRTMNDVSPDTPKGDRYRIEDVPFTQYFQGSYALHAAFWHDRFGTRRSHGCVNLSPHDARVVFESTSPALHDGWFGTYADGKRVLGTRVYITP